MSLRLLHSYLYRQGVRRQAFGFGDSHGGGAFGLQGGAVVLDPCPATQEIISAQAAEEPRGAAGGQHV